MHSEIPVYVNYGIARYVQMCQQFVQFLKSVPFQSFQVTKDQAPVGVIVAARNNSGIPFCNIAIALLYAQKGYPVTMIWDDLDFLDPDWEAQNQLLSGLIRFIGENAGIDTIQLSTIGRQRITADDEVHMRDLGFRNAIWNVRNVIPNDALDTYARLSYETMCANAGAIKQLYAAHSFDHCVHQSLLNNNGGVHQYFANQVGIRVSCFDISHGRGLIGLDAICGQYLDVLPLLEPGHPHYLFGKEGFEARAVDIAKRDQQQRVQGTDDRSTQPGPGEATKLERYDIVIPLNIFWDSAALIKPRFFASPFDWLIKTVAFILEHTSFSVVVRQHPHEAAYDTAGHVAALATHVNGRFGANPRFRFVESTEKVNTYDLIAGADLVLPYTSTLGVEAALMGKRVVVGTNVYYAGQPFVYLAESIEDYFDQIQRAKEPHASGASILNGWLLYFLTTKASFVYSPFGLIPPDIQKWTADGFASMCADEMLGMAIDCLATNTPFAYENGKRILKEAVAARQNRYDPHITHHP